MQVSVSNRGTDLTEEARAAAVDKIGRLDRFLDGMQRAEVRFSREHNPSIAEKEVCEVTIEGNGHVVRCRATAADVSTAVDRAVDKLESQLARLKSRLRRRPSHARRPESEIPVTALLDDEDHSMADDAYVTRAGELVVKRKSFALHPISVDDAVLQLELIGHSFYVFTNEETGRAAVLYRRTDGTLGLIDQA
ncbi:MAG: ribosome-associated translation inhibitor RaiA [Actinobacteria bacterium]|nr:ribosome-associated translation inhibitor RaiA [Actinomycetota bacterium]